jgi:hypothetical protein
MEELTLYDAGNDALAESASSVPDASVGEASPEAMPSRDADGSVATPEAAADAGLEGSTANICDEYAAVACDAYQRCIHVEFYYTTLEVCLVRERLACLAELSAPATGATPDQIHTCLQAEKVRDCSRNFRTSAACVIKGKVPDGASCWSSWQCQGGLCKGAGLTCGVCHTLGQPGDPCADGTECADIDTMICQGPAGSQHCVKAPGKDEPCASGICKVGTWCSGGICTDAPMQGDGDDCTTRPCDGQKQLVCDLVTHKCRPITFHLPGEACDVLDNCVGAGYCLNQYNRTCSKISPDGQACGSGMRCTLPARCDNGICKIPDPARCSMTDAGKDAMQ